MLEYHYRDMRERNDEDWGSMFADVVCRRKSGSESRVNSNGTNDALSSLLPHILAFSLLRALEGT